MSYVDILSPGEVESWIEQQQEPPDAVGTHLGALNRICRDNGGGVGLGMGWHVVIGGDTGHGKSLLALNVAKDAIRNGERVGFVTLEMSTRELKTRFYSILTGVPVRQLEPGASFSRESAEKVHELVAEQTAKHGAHPFFINSDSLTSLGAVMEMMHQWRDEGCRVFVIDYLQLCNTADQDNLSRELVQVSTAIRSFAKDNGVLTVALSQYNYNHTRSGQRPRYFSLYGSARIGQDSDLCLLLDNTRREREPGRRYISRSYLIVDKNRHGDDGEIMIEWDYRTLTSREGLPDEAKLWPT